MSQWALLEENRLEEKKKKEEEARSYPGLFFFLLK